MRMWIFTIIFLILNTIKQISSTESALTVSYPGSSTTYINLSPDRNSIVIPLFTKQIHLSTNFTSGIWISPNGTLVHSPNYSILLLTLTTEGRYLFNSTYPLNVFILDIIATGIPLATRSSQDVYTPLSNNSFFMADQELVCLTGPNTQVSWYYQLTSRSNRQQLVASTNTEGVSVFSTQVANKQGFYSCDIVNKGIPESYIVGVFDATRTTEIINGASYSYTTGIDRQDIWVVCDPKNNGYDLRDVYINLHGVSYDNPLQLYSSKNTIIQGHGSMNCFYNTTTDTFVSATFLFQGPPEITLTSDTTTHYSILPPNTNSANVRVLTPNVTLQTNLTGRWMGPDGVDTVSNVTLSYFTANFAGLYSFNVTSWEGNQVLAIQMSISATGTNFAEYVSQDNYRLLSGNILLRTDITLVCATSDTSKQIQWQYRPTQSAAPTNKSPSFPVDSEGLSVLFIMTSSPGYYRCEVGGLASYEVALFNPNSTIIATPGMSYYYIRGVDPSNILLLCYIQSTVTPLSLINLKLPGVDPDNPIKFYNLNAMDATQVTCRYRTSVLFASVLTVYDPSFTLSYTGFNTSFYSTLSPNIITLIIPLFSTQVLLSTNMEFGVWILPDSSLVATNHLSISNFSLEAEGRYTFNTTLTWNRGSNTVFVVNIISAESATISYPGSSTKTYTNLSPITNSIQIPLFTKQILLSTNLASGVWITPNGTLVHSPNYPIQLLTLTTEGIYLFNSTYPLNVIQIFILNITATGIPLATRSSQDVYTPLSNNSFFMADQELVCLTGPNTQVSWYYQLTSRSNRRQLVAFTNTEGVSVFSTQVAIRQGFYSCDIINKGFPGRYIVGVFDAAITTEIVNGASYSYTVGIDRQDIWVVCDPKNSSYDLKDVYINLRGVSYGNPIKLYSFKNMIIQGHGSMNCFYNTTTDTFVSAILLFQGPPVITLTSDTTTHYSLIPPNTNSANVRVLTPNVTLQTNLTGRWMGPDGVDTVSNIALRYFTANFAGLYSFNVTSWEGNQVLAIQMSISATGSNFAEYVSQDNYRLLSGNILLRTDITLVCATSDTSQQIQWQYRPTQSAAPTNKSSSFPVDSEGLSVLFIMTSSPGYYRCEVGGLASYEVALFNPDITIIVVPGMSYYYIRGVDPSNILLLCHTNNTAIQLSLINLKLPGVDPDNPIKLYNLNAMDATQGTCRYRTSVLFASMLTVYDPTFTLSYTGFNTSIYSTLSPNITTLIIPLFSTQVLLSTSIESGVWILPDSSLVVFSHLSIPNFSLETEGRYTFNTSLTWNRGSITVFVVNIISAESAVTISYPGSSTTNYTNLSPITNSIQIPLFTKQILLSTNLASGIWITPNGTLVNSPNYSIQLLTLTTEGRYLFNSTYPLNVFILDIIATGIPLATRSSQDVYTPLSNNSFFMADQELVCLTGPNTQVSWYYQQTSRSNEQQLVTSTNTEGVSIFSTQVAIKQGFYSCDIINKGVPETYIVGVFDAARTTKIVNGTSYSYTVGIDRQDIWVVCDPKNSSYDLRDVYFSLRGVSYGNPLKLYTNRNTILQGQGSMDCFYRNQSDTVASATLLFQGPPVITLTSDTTTHYSLLPPNTNSANVRVLTPNVTLQTNLMGRWMGPDGVDTVSNIALRYFTANFAGLYSFNVTSWEGNQVVAIQISISASGSNLAEYVSHDDFRLLSGNNIFYTDITLVCATSDTSQQIQWLYRPTQSAAPTNISLSFPVDSEGLSVLFIMTSSPGYYRCEVATLASYEVALFSPDNTIIVTHGMSYYYIRGVDPSNILLLCHLDSTAIPLSTVKLYLFEVNFDNPIKLYNQNAMDATQVTCRVGIADVYSIMLTVYVPTLTIVFPGSNHRTFTDLSPIWNSIRIPLFTKQIHLSTNLASGTWITPDGSFVHSANFTIQLLTLTTEGRYLFNSTQTWNGVVRQVFAIDITTTGNPFSIQDVYTPISNNSFFMTDQELVCLTGPNTQVSWYYQLTSRSNRQQLVASTNTEGVSVFSTQVAIKQGFFSCDIVNKGVLESYIVGVFDATRTTELANGASYSYTVGIDRQDIWVVCDPKNSSYDLRDVYISLRGISYDYPLKLYSHKNSIIQGQENMNCFYRTLTDTFVSATLLFQGPPVITLTSDTTTHYSLLPPNTNSANVRVLTPNVTLQTNLMGRWMGPDGVDTVSNIALRYFTANLAGLYSFNVTSWEGNQVVAIQISISASGSNFAEYVSQDNYRLLSSNILLHTDITLVCATNDTSKQIQWQYRPTQSAAPTNKSSSFTMNSAGLSALFIMTSSPGYYRCEVGGLASYEVALFSPDSTIIATPGMSYYYIRGVDPSNILLLCHIKSTVTPLSLINLKLPGVDPDNPIKLYDLNAMDATQVTCQVGIADIYTFMLTVYDPSFTLSYTGFNTSINSTSSPIIITLIIPPFFTQVLFSTSIESGIWILPDSSLVVFSHLPIPNFFLEAEGRYTFNTSLTWNRGSNTVFVVNIIFNG